ncbi:MULTISPECIES: hypothetical protein [unclassified Haloparvum]|uniref:hypothetical protein n=1 Tax=Haloparvum sp. PAK95 TaxID=3418962 RepID=UPI003D2E9EE3
MAQLALTIIEIVGLLLTVLLVMIQLAARSVSAGDVDLSDDERSVIPMLIVAMLCLLVASLLSGLKAIQSIGSIFLSAAVVSIVGGLIALTVSSIDAAIAVADATESDQQSLDGADETSTQEVLE